MDKDYDMLARRTVDNEKKMLRMQKDYEVCITFFLLFVFSSFLFLLLSLLFLFLFVVQFSLFFG